MQKSDLVKLLYTLPKEDKKAIAKFIRSPLYNKRKDIILLFEYLIRKLPKKKQSALDKQRCFKAIFPGQTFDDQKMRYTMSYLLKCIEHYLVIKSAYDDDIDYQLKLAKAYRLLHLEKGFKRAQEKAVQLIGKSKHKASGFYEKAYQLELEKYIFTEGQERNAPRNLQELSQALDLEYLSKKLKQSCLSLAHQAVFNIDYENNFLTTILQFLNENDILENHPTIACYFYYYKAEIGEESPIYFKKLRQIINENMHLFPYDEKKIIYLMAINYCIKRSNKGEEEYLQELFTLYKIGLKEKIFFEQEYLSRFSFKNIVHVALRLKEYDWVESFIQKYRLKLEPKYRENYIHYNLSKLLYAKKNYKEAMGKLHQVEYDDFFLNLDAKILLLKIYYHLGEYDVLDSFLISFNRFLKRKTLIAYHQENYANTIRLTTKLLKSEPIRQGSQIRIEK